MKSIASQTYGFNGECYQIKLVTNNKEKHDGCYIITDSNGYEHNAGLWQRMRGYDFKNNKPKDTYIYTACSFNELKNGKKLGLKYFSLNDILFKQVLKYIDEKTI